MNTFIIKYSVAIISTIYIVYVINSKYLLDGERVEICCSLHTLISEPEDEQCLASSLDLEFQHRSQRSQKKVGSQKTILDIRDLKKVFWISEISKNLWDLR